MITASFQPAEIQISVTSLATGRVDRRDVVKAETYAGLAIHEAVGVTTLDRKPVVSVTHIASGRAVTSAFFETLETARMAAVAIAALPVDWTSNDRKHLKWPYLADAIFCISALCGGFEIESVIDKQPGGHA